MTANRVDIARSLKIIEGLKVQLLSVIAELFSGLYKGLEGNVLDALSAAIVILYSMADRLGISIRQIDMAVEEKLQDRVANPDNSLRQFEGELLNYWRGKGSWTMANNPSPRGRSLILSKTLADTRHDSAAFWMQLSIIVSASELKTISGQKMKHSTNRLYLRARLRAHRPSITASPLGFGLVLFSKCSACLIRGCFDPA